MLINMGWIWWGQNSANWVNEYFVSFLYIILSLERSIYFLWHVSKFRKLLFYCDNAKMLKKQIQVVLTLEPPNVDFKILLS